MMNDAITPIQGLLLRAGVYELLALGYVYPGTEHRERALALATDLLPWVGLIQPEWTGHMQQLQENLEQTDPAEAEAEFNQVFSGAVTASPYETSYEPDIFRKQHALADMAGFYRAFGFQLPEGSRWQPDHVGVQLEFCSILLQRTALALEHGGQEQSAMCVDALRNFLLDHLGRWSASFATDLEKVTNLPLYQQLAVLTGKWVEVELTALDLAPDRLKSRKIHPDDAEAPSCGGCTGCGPEGPVKGDPCPLPTN